MSQSNLKINQQFHDISLQLEILKMRVDRVETELKIKKDVPATPPAVKPKPEYIPPEKPVWQPVEQQPEKLEVSRGTVVKSTFEPSPVPPPAAVAMPRRNQKSVRDWESIIGGKWALWVGSFSIFLAIASFIAYSWDKLPPAPPWARVLMGIVAGFAMIGGALYSRSRLQKWFSEGLAGGGLAVIYLSLWAASQSFGLLSFHLTFILMGLTTAFGVVLALRFDAISLSILAMLGGFMTPLLLQGSSSAVDSSTALLIYLAVLNTGIVAISIYKRWNALTWLNLLATYILLMGYFANGFSVQQNGVIFCYLTYYFLLFVAASCFYSLAHREKTSPGHLLLLIAAASFHGIFGQVIIDEKLGHFPGAFCVAMAVFFACMVFITWKLASENKTLLQSTFGLALMFITISIPLQFQQEVLVMAWCIEAGLLLVLGLRFRSELLQRFGQVLWCISIFLLMPTFVTWAAPPHFAFLNEWALTLMVAIVATAAVVVQQCLIINRSDSQRPAFYDNLIPIYTCAAILGGAALIANELGLLNSWHLYPDSQTWQAATCYFICMAVAVFGLFIFSAGVALRDSLTRMCAMLLLSGVAAYSLWGNAVYSSVGWHPFLNYRWLTFVVLATVITAFGLISKKYPKNISSDELSGLQFWPIGVSGLILLGMSIEIFRAISPVSGTEYARAFAAVSLLWIVYGTALQLIAFQWRSAMLRVFGLGIALCSGLLFAVNSGFLVSGESRPFSGLRTIALAAAVISFIVMALCEKEQKTKNNLVSLHWSSFILFAGATLIWGLSQEIYITFKEVIGTSNSDWNYLCYFCLSILWVTGAAALVYSGVRKNWSHFRNTGYGLVIVGFGVLSYSAIDSLGVGWVPFINLRFLAFLVTASILGGGAWWLSLQCKGFPKSEKDIIGIAAWTSGFLVLWCLTQEAFEACSFYKMQLGGNWVLWAQMSISLVGSVFGAILLMLGISRKYQPLRYVSLGILSLTVFKVFIFDLSFLDGVLRILSLGGLGISLIFISWLYSRYVKSDSVKSEENVET